MSRAGRIRGRQRESMHVTSSIIHPVPACFALHCIALCRWPYLLHHSFIAAKQGMYGAELLWSSHVERTGVDLGHTHSVTVCVRERPG